MKKFLCLMIFTIGLMVSLPEPSSGSGSPPDQVCFAVDQSSISLPVMVADQVLTASCEVTFEGYESFKMAMAPEKGGFVVDQGKCLEKRLLYLTSTNITQSNANKSYILDFRLCPHNNVVENQNRNLNSSEDIPVTIRADSQNIV